MPDGTLLDLEENVTFLVDGFLYRSKHPTCSHFFLSHFHSDHTQGLNNKTFLQDEFGSNKIFCSKLTGDLICQLLYINSELVYGLEYGEEAEILCSEAVGRKICLLEANHCPGAAIGFVWTYKRDSDSDRKIGVKPILNQIFLHCGDFRADVEVLKACQKFLREKILREYDLSPKLQEQMR